MELELLQLSIWWRLFIFVAGIGFGFLCLMKTLQIVTIIGKMPWAEEKLGPGGTYTMVKLFGIFIMAAVVVIAVSFR
jgi:uncharacterized protein YhhL (DUF1145 family)